MASFLRHVIQELGLSPDDFGRTTAEKSFILESHFYHWVLDASGLDLNMYDIVRDTTTWNCSEDAIGCSFSHLIFAVVYNLTNRERGKHTYTSKAEIQEVVGKLEDLGYSDTEVYCKLFELYKKKERYLGMLETSRFQNVRSPKDLKPDDEIWLTPRAANMCEYVGLKYLFMLALLRKNRIADSDGRLFDYDDRQPVSQKVIGSNLHFLCSIENMHIHGLSRVEEHLRDTKRDWLGYFRKWYCIQAYDAEDGMGDLLFRNVVRSHVKFLRRQSTLGGYDYITDMMIGQYLALQEAFDREVSRLGKADEHSSEISAKTFLESLDLSCFEEPADKEIC
jgi:hypothetical protein